MGDGRLLTLYYHLLPLGYVCVIFDPRRLESGEDVKKLWLLVALVVLLGGQLVSANSAQANYFGPDPDSPDWPENDCCRFADNDQHTIYYEVVPNQFYRDAMDYGFAHLDGTALVSVRTYERTSATDVRFIAGYTHPSYVAGAWRCDSPNSVGECETGRAFLNREKLDGEGANAKAHTACHELGHSTGLAHATVDESCLRQGINESKVYTTHDRNHLNSRYN